MEVRVLVTGSSGTLGTAVAPLLTGAGHELVLADLRPPEPPDERFTNADVRDIDQLRPLMYGVDYVVHTAAIHGIHLRDHSARDFFELNLAGTFNVWEAALDAGVRGVVYSSTMGVYGSSRQPAAADDVVRVDEDLPLQPTDVYAYTKVAGEEMCRYVGRQYGIPSIALRFGMFVPEPFFRYGIRLLYGGVDTDDVAAAVMAAIDALIGRRTEWDAFNVHSALPFTEADGPDLRRDPLSALDRHFPGAAALLRERGVAELTPIDSWFPMSRIEQRLGFRPRCNFEQWLEELRRQPEASAEKSPPWP
jgi:nucleoside-diphosphate-sugar epimerase